MPKYKLLKDLSKGTTLEGVFDILSNPDWFEEVKEPLTLEEKLRDWMKNNHQQYPSAGHWRQAIVKNFAEIAREHFEKEKSDQTVEQKKVEEEYLENLRIYQARQMMNIYPRLKEDKPERWKPEEGKRYFSVGGTGNVVDIVWRNDVADNQIYYVHNCFRTEEEAKQALERVRKALKGEA